VGSLAGVGIALGAVVALAAGVWLGRLMVKRQAEAWQSGIRSVTRAIADAARAEQVEIRRAAELAAREDALAAGAANEAQSLEREAELAAAAARLRRREEALAVETADLDARRARLGAPRQRAEAHEAGAAELRRQARALEAEAPAALERGAGQTMAALRARLIETEIEDARITDGGPGFEGGSRDRQQLEGGVRLERSGRRTSH